MNKTRIKFRVLFERLACREEGAGGRVWDVERWLPAPHCCFDQCDCRDWGNREDEGPRSSHTIRHDCNLLANDVSATEGGKLTNGHGPRRPDESPGGA